MTKRALIIGIAGQDGSYLSRLLLDKGYEVHGTSRNAANARFDGLRSLEVLDRVRLYTADLTNYHIGIELLRAVKPLEIYNLSAQSSVGLSFEQPIETLNSIVNATLNLLEAIRLMGGEMRLYNASSSEMYGDTASRPADENTFFRPHSPYGVSKAAAHWLVENYRKAYGLFACSGIMFNHESPLRNERFVTQKIVRAAVDIRRGAARRLILGNLAVVRDWGWAPEYVEAMWLMLQQDTPEDYVIATGNAASLEEFTKTAFEQVDLNWRDYVDHDPDLFRPYEVDYTVGKPIRAAERLLWTARLTMPEIVTKLVDAEQKRRERLGNQIACGTP